MTPSGWRRVLSIDPPTITLSHLNPSTGATRFIGTISILGEKNDTCYQVDDGGPCRSLQEAIEELEGRAALNEQP